MKKAKIPKGIVKSAILKNAWKTAFFVMPGAVLFWAFIFVVPWVGIFWDQSADPLGVNFVQWIRNPEDEPLPWVTLLVTVIIGLLSLLAFLGALITLFAPSSHSALTWLRREGHDPAQAITEFQSAYAEIGRGACDLVPEKVTVTPSWTFLNIDGDVHLYPTSKLAWVYFDERTDFADTLATAAVSEAADLSSRQRQQVSSGSGKKSKLFLQFYDIDIPETLDQSPRYARDRVVKVLEAQAPHVIFGRDSGLKKLWQKDQTTFEQEARQFIETLRQQGNIPPGLKTTDD